MSVNIGAALATGGGGDRVKEQLACIHIPSLSGSSFTVLERTMGAAWREILFLKDFAYLKRCIACDTFGSIGMETALFTTA